MSTEAQAVRTTGAGGVGFTGALTLLFVALKLTGHIAWSWQRVLSPLWISFLAFVAMFVVFAAVTFVVAYWPLKRTTRIAMNRSAK